MNLELEYGESTSTYRGYDITVAYDGSPECPWDDWDGLAPLICYSSNGVKVYGANLPDPLADVSDAWLNSHWKAIAKALDVPAHESADYKRDYNYATIADARRDLTQELLDSYMRNHPRDYMQALAAIYEARGMVTLATSSRGYAQSDWAELLLVNVEPNLSRADAMRNLEVDAKLWSAWAWGDVYGYTIERDGEHIDSCWGFYGEHEESGLLENVRSAIEYAERQRHKAHQAKLKTLISNRVPLEKRAALLAD